MLRPRIAWLALLLLVLPAPASAQIVAPGLALDRADLRDDSTLMDTTYVDPRAKGPSGSQVFGLIGAAGPYPGSMPASLCIAGCTNTILGSSAGSPVVLSNTLRPASAMGLVALSATYGMVAALYEPDSLKRTPLKQGKSRIQLRQKDYVGIREVYLGPSFTALDPMVALPGCKAQFDLRTDTKKGLQTARFKLSCNPELLEEALEDEEIEARQALFARLFGKPRIGFDLRGERPLPP